MRLVNTVIFTKRCKVVWFRESSCRRGSDWKRRTCRGCIKKEREMGPERGRETLNIHVMFNNKMKSFILNWFSSKKKKRKSCRDGLSLWTGTGSSLFQHKSSRKRQKVQTRRHQTLGYNSVYFLLCSKSNFLFLLVELIIRCSSLRLTHTHTLFFNVGFYCTEHESENDKKSSCVFHGSPLTQCEINEK